LQVSGLSIYPFEQFTLLNIDIFYESLTPLMPRLNFLAHFHLTMDTFVDPLAASVTSPWQWGGSSVLKSMLSAFRELDVYPVKQQTLFMSYFTLRASRAPCAFSEMSLKCNHRVRLT